MKIKTVKPIELAAGPGGVSAAWPGGLTAGASREVVTREAERQGLDPCDVTRGRAAFSVPGLRLRVVGLAMCGRRDAYVTTYLVAREGLAARLLSFLNRGAVNRAMAIWRYERRLYPALKGRDNYDIPRHSLTNLFLRACAPLREVQS